MTIWTKSADVSQSSFFHCSSFLPFPCHNHSSIPYGRASCATTFLAAMRSSPAPPSPSPSPRRRGKKTAAVASSASTTTNVTKTATTAAAAARRLPTSSKHPDALVRAPGFPLAAFLWPARGSASQWEILPLILLVAALFRWAAGLWRYSGADDNRWGPVSRHEHLAVLPSHRH